MNLNLFKNSELFKTLFVTLIIFATNPLSYLKILQDLMFYNYQNLSSDIFNEKFLISLTIFQLIFYFAYRDKKIFSFLIFVIFYDLYFAFSSLNQLSLLNFLFLLSITGLFSKVFSDSNFKTKEYSIYLFPALFTVVFLFTYPISSGWAPSEWMKVSRGYFGYFGEREILSSFMTPNTPRTFIYDIFSGSLIKVFGLEAGYLLLKVISIFLISYSIFSLFKSLKLRFVTQLTTLFLFVLSQDLIGGNVVIGIFEEDRFAIGFAILGIANWIEKQYFKLTLFSILSILFHIQVGIFWFTIIFLYELINKNVEKLKYFYITILLTFPITLPTIYELIFTEDRIVFQFGKPSSWVYSFIFQAYHVGPFEVSGVQITEFLTRNWSKGFTNIFFVSLLIYFVKKKTSEKKIIYLCNIFILYFPVSLLLHFIDSKLTTPGKLSSLFLFRHDTVFYLIFLALVLNTIINKNNFPFAIALSLTISTFGINDYIFKQNKYSEIDQSVISTQKFLQELNPDFILIDPNIELYTGGIEIRTGIETYVSTKYITNSLSNFPNWYDKHELRGRYFQGECNLFNTLELEYFISRQDNNLNCGELVYKNGNYSVFKAINQDGFILPPYNNLCTYSESEAFNLLNEYKLKYDLDYQIKIIYESHEGEDCLGNVIGSNLEQNTYIDESIEEIVLVVKRN